MGRRRVVGGLAVPGRVAVAMVLAVPAVPAFPAFPVVRVRVRRWGTGMVRGLMAAMRLTPVPVVLVVLVVPAVRCLKALRA